MSVHIEMLREVWCVVERKNGAVFKTEFVERRWVPVGTLLGHPDGNPDLMWVSLSTTYSGKAVRTVVT